MMVCTGTASTVKIGFERNEREHFHGIHHNGASY
jgi:hypothetical protein